MNDLYNALENCLQGMDEGQELDAVLVNYPKNEQELRQLLEVSLLARNSGHFTISEASKHRGRVRLLQSANELRKVNGASHCRMIPLIPRVAIALGLVGIMALTGTGFVSASSGTLPGDQLYPVKRSWEGVRLLFAFNTQERDLLESQYDQERLDEIGGLLGKRKAAPIEFIGLVTKQTNDRWQVSGIPVTFTGSVSSPNGAIQDGAPVMVTGITSNDGIVEAQKVQVLQPGGPMPPLGLSEKGESYPDGEQEGGDTESTPVAVATPSLPVPGPQAPAQAQKSYQFSGVVQSMLKDVWIINGQSVYMDQADVVAGIKIGSVVIFDGYFDSGGKFIVTMAKVKSSDNLNKPQKGTGGNNGSGSSGNGSDDHHGGSGGSDGGDSGGSDDGGN
jgi:uncharacterized membrane protein YgcG